MPNKQIISVAMDGKENNKYNITNNKNGSFSSLKSLNKRK